MPGNNDIELNLKLTPAAQKLWDNLQQLINNGKPVEIGIDLKQGAAGNLKTQIEAGLNSQPFNIFNIQVSALALSNLRLQIQNSLNQPFDINVNPRLNPPSGGGGGGNPPGHIANTARALINEQARFTRGGNDTPLDLGLVSQNAIDVSLGYLEGNRTGTSRGAIANRGSLQNLYSANAAVQAREEANEAARIRNQVRLAIQSNAIEGRLEQDRANTTARQVGTSLKVQGINASDAGFQQQSLSQISSFLRQDSSDDYQRRIAPRSDINGRPKSFFENIRSEGVSREVGLSALFGAVNGNPSQFIGGTLGAAIGGGITGTSTGARIGGATGNIVIDGIVKSFEALKDSLVDVAQAGLTFQRSVLGITAVLSQSSQYVGANGQPLDVGQQVQLQKKRARGIQLAARSQASQVGIGGEAESSLVQAILTGAGSRGFELNEEQAATLTARLGSALNIFAPELAGNPATTRRDIFDVIKGSPQASRTAVGSRIPQVIEQIKSASNSDELVRATDSLKSLITVFSNSGDAIAQIQRFNAIIDNTKTVFGEAIVDKIGPGLKEFVDTLNSKEVASALKEFGTGIGVFSNQLIRDFSSFTVGFSAFTNSFSSALKDFFKIPGMKEAFSGAIREEVPIVGQYIADNFDKSNESQIINKESVFGQQTLDNNAGATLQNLNSQQYTSIYTNLGIQAKTAGELNKESIDYKLGQASNLSDRARGQLLSGDYGDVTRDNILGSLLQGNESQVAGLGSINSQNLSNALPTLSGQISALEGSNVNQRISLTAESLRNANTPELEDQYRRQLAGLNKEDYDRGRQVIGKYSEATEIAMAINGYKTELLSGTPRLAELNSTWKELNSAAQEAKDKLKDSLLTGEQKLISEGRKAVANNGGALPPKLVDRVLKYNAEYNKKTGLNVSFLNDIYGEPGDSDADDELISSAQANSGFAVTLDQLDPTRIANNFTGQQVANTQAQNNTRNSINNLPLQNASTAIKLNQAQSQFDGLDVSALSTSINNLVGALDVTKLAAAFTQALQNSLEK